MGDFLVKRFEWKPQKGSLSGTQWKPSKKKQKTMKSFIFNSVYQHQKSHIYNGTTKGKTI